MDWNKKVLEYLKDKFDSTGISEDYREALLQHYGLKTTWLDAVDHIQTACWFACNDKEKKEYIPELKTNNIESDVGFIYLLGVPDEANTWAKYIDLRQKPSEWLRPHVQQAYAIRLNDALSFGTSLNHLCILTFLIPKQLLLLWSNSQVITEEIIYPHYNHDRGIKHHNLAMKRLDIEGIGSNPPIVVKN